MDTMLSKALREFMTGPLNQLLVNLGGHDSSQWERELKKFLRKEICWTSILAPVSTVRVSATAGKFVAKKKFVVNTKRKAQVKIATVSVGFARRFLSGVGKIEDPISEQTLSYYKLLKPLSDASIIPELGGEEKCETTLSEMFSLMEKQKNGEPGVLLNIGYVNLFYIRDQNGVLCAVTIFWDAGGWNVYAVSLGGGYGFGAVFSRNSVLESSETLAPAKA